MHTVIGEINATVLINAKMRENCLLHYFIKHFPCELRSRMTHRETRGSIIIRTSVNPACVLVLVMRSKEWLYVTRVLPQAVFTHEQ